MMMMDLTSTNILVIGAGGIGCELIKNLALLKVGAITVVDLDTIDISNLNRQFLFRREHVGKPKAQVAAMAAKKLNPMMTIEYMCENVKNFDHSFVAKFDLVMSALDNIDARRYLNRICLTANRPLIEAGSTGYIGQSRVILKNKSECYECQKKEAPKIFPVCTIRSAPSTPIHCIQWAKLLYELLFGPNDDSSVIQDMHIRSDSPIAYLKHLFCDDIITQASMTDKWVGKAAPRPLTVAVELPDEKKVDSMSQIPVSECQSILGVEKYMEMFLWSVRTIIRDRSDLVGQLSFTKDDPVAVDFVAAASNLRMFNYHIPMKSRWDIESIAGAIVPAIATTNAIVAGLQCFNIASALNASPGRDLWVRYPHPSGNGSIVQSTKPSAPNKECFICQSKMVTVGVPYTWSLAEFVQTVIKDQLSIAEPSVIMNGNLIYDALEDDEEITVQYRENLHHWDFTKHGQMIQVEDPSTDETYHLSVSEMDNQDGDEEVFTLGSETITSSKRPRLA